MATTPCAFRPDAELYARIEQWAFEQGMTKAELLRTAVRHYLDTPAPFPWRRQFGALLVQVLLCKAYSHSLARQVLGEDAVAEGLPAVEDEARLEVEALLDRLDELERL